MKIHNDLSVNEPYILITFTTGFGDVPDSTHQFLEENSGYLQAIAVSGNRNWGNNYGRAGDIISAKYNVPILMKFELSGTIEDIKTFYERLRQFETHRVEQ